MTLKRNNEDGSSDATSSKKSRRHLAVVTPELEPPIQAQGSTIKSDAPVDLNVLALPKEQSTKPLTLLHTTTFDAMEQLVNSFIIVGQVVNKVPIRQVILNMEKQPMLLFEVQDATRTMHCYAYKELAVHLDTTLEISTTVKLSQFLLRPVNKCFSASNNTYELLLSKDTKIEHLQVQLNLPHTPTPYSTLADIYCMEDKTVINTRGTIKNINAPVEKKSSQGSILVLTTIVLRDMNNTTMILNLWNERGTTFAFHVDDDILIQNCKVSLYGGSPSISAFASTEFSLYQAH